VEKVAEPKLPKLCARCGRPLPLDSNDCLNCGVVSSRPYRRSTIVAVWLLCSVLLFVVAGGISRAYEAKREALAERWFQRGLYALQVSQPENAIAAFRNALAYSSHNPQYRLQLAEALLAAGRKQEALDYFESLWQENPSDGRVNLALARLHAQRKDIPQATRYYHGAVYGEWPEDPIRHRQEVQLELVKFLLQNNAKAQAQSELLELAEEAPNDPDLHLQIADLLAQAGDFADALQESRKVIRLEPDNAAALRRAGADSFQLGRYAIAERYLRRALEHNRNDQEAEALLDKLRMIAHANPYQRGLRLQERQRRVIQAFTAAGARLQSCAQQRGETLDVEHATSELQKLYEEWGDLSPGMNQRFLRQQPDLADNTMELVFRIEGKAKALCGPPAGLDEALLLIGENREGTGQ
jgi:Flp pilus assembly protein TadD